MTDVEWAAISIAAAAVSYAIGTYANGGRRIDDRLKSCSDNCERLNDVRFGSISSDIDEIRQQITCIRRSIQGLSEQVASLKASLSILTRHMGGE